MDLKDKHPAEEEFQKLLEAVRILVKECENTYISWSDKEDLKELRTKFFNIQMKRLNTFINKYGKIDGLPADEEKLLMEMSDLLLRMNKIIGDADFL